MKFRAEVTTSLGDYSVWFSSFDKAVKWCQSLARANMLTKACIGCQIFGTMYVYQDDRELFDVGI